MGNTVCHSALAHPYHTCSTSCCLWRACSNVTRRCVSDRWSDWRAAEEEASTWLFSCSPKACSCWMDCCTEAWSPRHICNSNVIGERQVRTRTSECLEFGDVRQSHGIYMYTNGTGTTGLHVQGKVNERHIQNVRISEKLSHIFIFWCLSSKMHSEWVKQGFCVKLACPKLSRKDSPCTNNNWTT